MILTSSDNIGGFGTGPGFGQQNKPFGSTGTTGTSLFGGSQTTAAPSAFGSSSATTGFGGANAGGNTIIYKTR